MFEEEEKGKGGEEERVLSCLVGWGCLRGSRYVPKGREKDWKWDGSDEVVFHTFLYV